MYVTINRIMENLPVATLSVTNDVSFTQLLSNANNSSTLSMTAAYFRKKLLQ